MKLYMKCTTDELELPLAVADSPKELAVMLKANYGTIATMVSRQICGYHKVEIEDTELYPDMVQRSGHLGNSFCGGINEQRSNVFI